MEADDSPVSNRRLVLCRNSVRGSMLNPTKIAMTPRETRRSSEEPSDALLVSNFTRRAIAFSDRLAKSLLLPCS